MTDAELFGFVDVFNSLAQVFPIRGEEHERQQRRRAYFKALRRFPLDRVAAGADAWTRHGKAFPKPVEWAASIPRSEPTTTEIPVMTAEEARQWHRADGLRYEDAPCACRVCVAAGIHTRPIRFVPEFTPEDNDRKVQDPDTGKIVTAGHWAHGDELVRWYAAKERFWTLARAAIKRHSMPSTTGNTKNMTTQQRIDAAFARRPPVEDEREPGQEG